jgi:hypothetical protein
MGRPILGGTETLADIAVSRGSGLTAQQMVAAATIDLLLLFRTPLSPLLLPCNKGEFGKGASPEIRY